MCNIVWLYHIHIYTYVRMYSLMVYKYQTHCIYFIWLYIWICVHFSRFSFFNRFAWWWCFFRSPFAYIVFGLTTIWNPFLIYYWILHVDSNTIRVSIVVWAAHRDNIKWIGLATQLDFYILLIFHFAKVLNHLNFDWNEWKSMNALADMQWLKQYSHRKPLYSLI